MTTEELEIPESWKLSTAQHYKNLARDTKFMSCKERAEYVWDNSGIRPTLTYIDEHRIYEVASLEKYPFQHSLMEQADGSFECTCKGYVNQHVCWHACLCELARTEGMQIFLPPPDSLGSSSDSAAAPSSSVSSPFVAASPHANSGAATPPRPLRTQIETVVVDANGFLV